MRNNRYTNKDHTFVVCAYKESEYLPECIESLLTQTVKSKIIISTATPNEYIEALAKKHCIEVRVNPEPPSIAGDWSFAYKQADTRLITLAHQDDIYLPDYLVTALKMLNKSCSPIIFFSHYAEIDGGEVHRKRLRLCVKKLLLWPLRFCKRSIFIRRRVLSLGSPICCPSVMYVDLENVEFTTELIFCLDWHKWEELSKLKGSFVYSNKPLMYHRLHSGAETAKAIQDGTRRKEDYIMFRKFWRTPLAKIITKLYTKSEEGGGGEDI